MRRCGTFKRVEKNNSRRKQIENASKPNDGRKNAAMPNEREIQTDGPRKKMSANPRKQSYNKRKSTKWPDDGSGAENNGGASAMGKGSATAKAGAEIADAASVTGGAEEKGASTVEKALQPSPTVQQSPLRNQLQKRPYLEAIFLHL